MVISYCEKCGVLMRYDSRERSPLCVRCSEGSRREARSRDSGLIPYARRPSSGEILREIKATVRWP